MVNLYLFRNVLNSAVVVSPYYRITTKSLRQIRAHREQKNPRPDHWTPFLVLSGLTSVRIAEKLKNKILHLKKNESDLLHRNKLGPGPKVRLPLTEQHQKEPWTVPLDIRRKVKVLCKILSNSSFLRAEVKKISKLILIPLSLYFKSSFIFLVLLMLAYITLLAILKEAKSKKEMEKKKINKIIIKEVKTPIDKLEEGNSKESEKKSIKPNATTADAGETNIENIQADVDSNLSTSLKDSPILKIFWERDDFKFVVNEDQLLWPTFVQHEKLILHKGRFPKVPQFSFKTLNDKYAESLGKENTPQDFTKRKDFKKLKGYKSFDVDALINDKKFLKKNQHQV
ncbi:hypothetical protein HDU92_008651 [Lobulomyces angularis]|nr:hypothetical protein HDU92_008651 [Lobulomyces angularis]